MIAKIIISSLSKRVEEIERLLLEHDIKNPHPDLFYISSDSKLGIEQAKKIKDHFTYKPTQAKGKAVVLESADNLTPEAQNALLKTIEELPDQALFLMGADSDANFLPTILSRCQIVILEGAQRPIESDKDAIASLQHDIEKLIKSDIPERFEYIEKLKEKDEFLHALVFYFHQNLRLHPKGVIVEFIEELLQAEKWAKQNVNIRGILEYLMLVMPN